MMIFCKYDFVTGAILYSQGAIAQPSAFLMICAKMPLDYASQVRMKPLLVKLLSKWHRRSLKP